MNGKIITNTSNCACCDAEYELEEFTTIDCELICVECVEDDAYSDNEHTNESRLSVWERNQ